MHSVRLFLLTLLAVAVAQGADHVILITIDGYPARMFHDSKTHAPNIRRLASEGVVAKGMRASNPTVTWPNHTTLVTGVQPRRHSVLFNGVLRRGATVRIDPEVTAKELVAVPTIFEALKAENLTTAGVNWPCTRLSPALDDDFPDSPNMVDFTTARLRQELVAEGILKSEKQADFAALNGPQRDEVWMQTACYLIRKRMPNFMAVHLLNTDSTHHKYGPESMASYTALALADRFVGDIVNAVKAAGKWNSTAWIVTADHGFAVATNVLQPNVLFRKAGLLEVSSVNTILKARVQCVPEGGSGLIYFTNPTTREEDRKKTIELLSGAEGVAELIGPERFEELGMPPAGQGGMGDLVLRPRKGYGVNGTANGDDFVIPVTPAISSGYHGYIADEDDMLALFVASGNGIKKGMQIGEIKNVDVAPTVARLLGKSLPDTDGKALTEILSPK